MTHDTKVLAATGVPIKTLLVIVTAVALAMSVMVPAMAGQTTTGNAANSLGKTTLDTTVHADSPDEMNYGDGIPNGQWVTAEIQGVEIGGNGAFRRSV